MIVLPAAGALYFSLSDIWNLPMGMEVVGTLAVITTFLSILLRVQTKGYAKTDRPYDGTIDITEDALNKKLFSLVLNGDPDDLAQMTTVTFKVNQP